MYENYGLPFEWNLIVICLFISTFFGLFSDYSPMLRMSFITFSSNADTIMKLTENRFMSF